MTFFYDLNKRLAQLADKQDAKQISEDAKAVAPKSKLAQALNERDMGKHNNATTGFAALAKKAGKEYGSKAAGERVAGAVKAKMAKAGKLEELSPATIQSAAAKRDAQTPDQMSPATQRKDIMTHLSNRVKMNNRPGMTEEGMCPACDCSPCECDSMEESAFQAAIGKKKYGDAGMKALQKAGREHASDKTMSNIRNRYDKYDESQGMTDEGNAFSKAVVDAKRDGIQKGEKIRVGGKELPLKELDMRLLKGAQGSMKGSNTDSESERNKHKKYGYRSDRDDTGNDDDYDEHGNLKNKKKSAVSDGPKKKGRPAKEKRPERVTAKSYKYKSGRPTKTKEDLDSDGVMMTRPSNMSSEGMDRAEYDDEAGMTKDSLHTIMRNARELENALRGNENLPEWVQEKVGQIKGMMSSVTDYILSTHERDAEQHMGREGITVIPENANFSGSEIQQAYRLAMMLKAFIKDPDGMKAQADLIKLLRYKLQQSNDTAGSMDQLKEKSVSQSQARMMAGAAHNPKFAKKVGVATKVAKEFNQADKGKDISKLPKKVKKTDEANDGNLANNAKPYDKVTQGDVVAGRLGKDEQGGKAKKAKEEKVDETTVSGSVATATPSGKPSKGMQFGKGVYESLNNSIEKMITESISIESKMQECGDGEMAPAITITADGEEAAKLMMLLKLAGLESQIPSACPTCGGSPCGCDQMVDENAPDWPTNTETLDADPNLRTYSGGLNGPKSTGQSTVPVLASQLRRQASMEESVALERSLFKTWKNYKG